MREGWTYKKLGECFPFIKNGANIKQLKDSDGLPITRIETLSGGVFNRDRMGYASIYDSSKYLDYILEDGDLLMSHINSKTYIGRTVEYKKERAEVIIHGMNLLRLKADRSLILPSFMAYYTNSTLFKSDVARIRKDAVNQSSMAIGDLRKIDIPLPPKSQQEAIVSEFDEINSLLALKREQLQKYDKLAQSLFYEMFGDPVENEKGWEVKKVSDVCSVFGRIGFRGYTKADFVESPEEGAISLSPTNIINNSMDYKKCSYVTWDKYHESPEIKARIGDILLVKTGSSYGKCALITFLPHKATINPQFVIIKNITINNRYLHYYLSSEAAKICYDNFVIGTAVPTFSQKNLNNMAVLVPPLSLQQQFASRIELIESQKQQVQAAIEKLETLLASRMQYWFE